LEVIETTYIYGIFQNDKLQDVEIGLMSAYDTFRKYIGNDVEMRVLRVEIGKKITLEDIDRFYDLLEDGSDLEKFYEELHEEVKQ